MERDEERPLEDGHPRQGVVVAGHLGPSGLDDHRPEDGKHLDVVCLDRDSGKIIHDLQIFDNPNPAFCIAANSYASSTPVIEEGRFYAHYGSAGTACLDTATGKVLWQRRDLPCDHFRGPGLRRPSSSGNLLILTFDGFDFQYLAALDKDTGKTRLEDRPSATGPERQVNGEDNKEGLQHSGRHQGRRPGAAHQPGGVWQRRPSTRKTGKEIGASVYGGMNAATRPLFGHGQPVLDQWRRRQATAGRPPRRQGRRHAKPHRLDLQQRGADACLAGAGRRSAVHGQQRRRGHLCRGHHGQGRVKKAHVWAEACGPRPLAVDGKVYFFGQGW